MTIRALLWNIGTRLVEANDPRDLTGGAVTVSRHYLHGDALARIETARRDNMGFLSFTDVRVIAEDPRTRLTQLLVRCGGCRFTAAAQDVMVLAEIIRREGSDYVRDVSLPAGGAR